MENMQIEMKVMKNISKQIFVICATIVALSSCVKADYTAETSHPYQAEIIVTPDWSDIGSGITPPEDIKVVIGGEVIDLGNGTLPLLEPGEYRIIIYNEVAQIDVTPTTVSRAVTVIGGAYALLPVTGGFIPTSHDWFFSGYMEIVVERDKSYAREVVMNQQTRELNFELTITEGEASRIKSITAELSGVAQGWDLVADEPYGESVKVAPVFTLAGNKLTSQVRLLGIKGATQVLTLNVTFTDDRTQTIVSDVTTQLAGFNSGKSLPMTLQGNVNTPISSEQGGSITNWNVITGNVTIN